MIAGAMVGAGVADELRACRDLAASGNLRRQPRAYLHSLLGRCMALALRCERDPDEFRALKSEVRVGRP